MSRGNWIAGIALGLALSTQCYGQEPETEPSPQPAQQEQSAQPTDQVPDTVLGADAPEVPENDAADENEAAEERGNAPLPFWRLGDLPAQAVMAWAAVAGAGLSLGAVILLWLTLKATRELGISQSRAYVNVMGAALEERDPARFKVTFKNTGQTPARNLTCIVRHRVWDKGKENFSEPEPTIESKMDLAAGGEFPMQVTYDRSIDDLTAIAKAGRQSSYIFGVARYWDVFFKEERVTEFRLELAYTPVTGQLGFRAAKEGNRST